MKFVKKAFNEFKKAIKEEGIDLSGRCYMNAQQIRNQTATICVGEDRDIDEVISNVKKLIESNTYKNDADFAVKCEETLKLWEDRKNQFGSQYRYLMSMCNDILKSEAFKKLAEAIKCTAQIETKINAYDQETVYIRVNYKVVG